VRAIDKARESLASCGFTPDQLSRQRELVSQSVAFLEPIVTSRQFRRGALDAFARTSAPLIMANATAAAAVQIDAYAPQVKPWRNRLGPDAWKRLTVVVIGRQLPRKENLAVQYFAQVLGVPGEGPRLVYAEELSGDDASIDLLGSHLLDREASRAFFGDAAR